MPTDFVPISARMTEVVEISLTVTMTPELATRYRKQLIEFLDSIEGADVHSEEFNVDTATLSQLTARMFDRQESPLAMLYEVAEWEPDLMEHYNTFASDVEC